MKILLNENAEEIRGEAKLLDRLKRASKQHRADATALAIAVRNASNEIRLLICTGTESEEETVSILLQAAGYDDELLVDYEDVDEDGNVECRTQAQPHPDFDCIYSLLRQPPVRTVKPPKEDPGPDPSWLVFYTPH